MNKKLTIEIDEYVAAVRAVGKLSKLFSESTTPFIHSRFVERLYVANTGSKDLSRSDISFDARHTENFGVGIKTFIASGVNTSKREKVAEFTRYGNAGAFNGLSTKALAQKVSTLRNARINADAKQYGLDLENSIYHCLVRVTGACLVIEEPYSLINIDALKPTDKNGKILDAWDAGSGSKYFTDGFNNYSFSKAKSVLMKQFQIKGGKNLIKSLPFEVPILDDPLSSMLDKKLSFEMQQVEMGFESEETLPRVVLPLYSSRGGKHVQEKSGINQWNAGGRARSFGEAYIPIPKIIHVYNPGFFPDRDVPFKLHLPNGKSVEAKVCQDGNKALMSKHNSDLVEWLYEIIDSSLDIAKKRFKHNRIYTYQDLINIGQDSVTIKKLPGKDLEYTIELAPLNSYEEYLDEF